MTTVVTPDDFLAARRSSSDIISPAQSTITPLWSAQLVQITSHEPEPAHLHVLSNNLHVRHDPTVVATTTTKAASTSLYRSTEKNTRNIDNIRRGTRRANSRTHVPIYNQLRLHKPLNKNAAQKQAMTWIARVTRDGHWNKAWRVLASTRRAFS